MELAPAPYTFEHRQLYSVWASQQWLLLLDEEFCLVSIAARKLHIRQRVNRNNSDAQVVKQSTIWTR